MRRGVGTAWAMSVRGEKGPRLYLPGAGCESDACLTQSQHEDIAVKEIKRSVLVAQSPARLFAIIADVESYPQFVPGCSYARIESREPHAVVATIGVRRGALATEFTTRNELEPERRVTMSLVRGPFSVLD